MLIFIILLLLLFGGGGGYYGYSHFGPTGGLVPMLLMVLLIVWLVRGGRLGE